jgi:hypothetical protein
VGAPPSRCARYLLPSPSPPRLVASRSSGAVAGHWVTLAVYAAFGRVVFVVDVEAVSVGVGVGV